MESPKPGELYCLVDDNPIAREEAMLMADELLAKFDRELIVDSNKFLMKKDSSSKDHHVSETVSPTVESKRVRNSKIKEDLELKLRFPSVYEGMLAICSGDISPFAIVL